MPLNTDAVSHEQLGQVVDLLEEVIVTRSDLGDLADLIEAELPALVAKAAPTVIVQPSPRLPWRLTVERDASGLMTGAILEPLEL